MKEPGLQQVLDLGKKDTPAADGVVTDTDLAMAYLKQLVNIVRAVVIDTGSDGVVLGTKAAAFKRLVGEHQIIQTTEDLNQAAATYDLFTGTIQAVLLRALTIKMPTGNAGGEVANIAIATDDATPSEIISAAAGTIDALLSEAELSWTGAMRINTDTKIQLILSGGSHPTEYLTTITAEYSAIADGGYLVETP